MRSTIPIVATVITLLLAACLWEGYPSPIESSVSKIHAAGWRRTVNGWEKSESWCAPFEEGTRFEVHPLVPATLLPLLSIAGLLLFSGSVHSPQATS